MKLKKILYTGISISLLMGSLTACKDFLDETPRANYTPEFFESKEGIEGGINSMYATLRRIYGNDNWFASQECGTDEYTWGSDAGNSHKAHDCSGEGFITPSINMSSSPWSYLFTDINTCHGVLEYGEAVGVDPALLVEARFFLAHDYFILVQTYGGVALDLGSGELKFNTSTVRTSYRNTVPEVYTRAIFPNLKECVEKLPDNPRIQGALTKTAARFYLAKAYLTYAWWLENPNDIPTYPLCDRVDPDGHNAAWYFQQAYNVAMEAIDNPGPFGLQETFYMVNLGENDRNSEIILYADHNEDTFYGTSPSSQAFFHTTFDYTQLQGSKSPDEFQSFKTTRRYAIQGCGRPWKRIAPPIEVSRILFADKVHDSRYDGTFTTNYYANWDISGDKTPVIYNANFLPIKPGDCTLAFLDYDDVNISYPQKDGKETNNSGVGAGQIPGKAAWVINQSCQSRRVYLNLWKIGPYRTDNDGGYGKFDEPSTRPFPAAKFSELYLIAAEAQIKGATGKKNARELINVLRRRAGKWSYRNNARQEYVADFSDEMEAATPATITLDYLLDERSRELFGDGMRWSDLVRTQTWEQRAATYTICGKNAMDHTPVTYTRTIDKYLYLRPIPQGQIDGLEMSDAEKKAYQNPGY